jgi:hypothetical protein
MLNCNNKPNSISDQTQEDKKELVGRVVEIDGIKQIEVYHIHLLKTKIQYAYIFILRHHELNVLSVLCHSYICKLM